MFFIIDWGDLFDFSGMAGGILFMVGAILVPILELIVGAGFLHQVSTLIFLFVVFLLIISIFAFTIQSFVKKDKDDQVAGVLFSVITIGFLIYGYITKPGVFLLSYKFHLNFLCALQAASLPSILFWILINCMKEDTEGGLLMYIFFIPVICMTLYCLITIGFAFGKAKDNNEGAKNFISKCMYYYDETQLKNRDKFETPLEMANLALEDYKKYLEENGSSTSGKDIAEKLKDKSLFRKEFLKEEYGYSCLECDYLEDGNLKYTIYDLVWKDEEHQTTLLFNVTENKFTEYNVQEGGE